MSNKTIERSNLLPTILYDLGFERGETVFTSLLFRNGVGFHFAEDHYPRLVEGCLFQGIDSKDIMFFEELLARVRCELARSNFAEAIVKIFITTGYSSNGRVPENGPRHFVTARPVVKISPAPLRFELQDCAREFAKYKIVGQYAFVRQRIENAKLRGCDEFLYATERTGITESPYRNIFFVRHASKKLVTPENCLHGVTRKIILHNAKAWAGFESVCEVSKIEANKHALLSFDEAFVTSSLEGLISVAHIDDTMFKIGGEAPFTEALKRGYETYQKEYFESRGA